ncbi:alpha/beta fold hydrolase [Streptomyces sp. KL110A]|uniref:alpha/beta fold hydrolase n=1 Tax=Streptomyces sp. KL110A TaxID=3384221 RepID=UPI0038C7DBCB
MSLLRIGGVAHHVAVDGHGPVCVLSAGLGLCWFDWDPVVPLLAPHRTVVRFDRPGHGLSQGTTAPPTLAGEAHRIAALLDALGLPGPVTVVGHSIAGLHAEGFARLHPDRTAALVLVDSSTEDHPRPGRLGWTVPAGTALTALGLPAALGPALRRLALRPTRRRPPRSAASTAVHASGAAPCARTPATAPSPPNSTPSGTTARSRPPPRSPSSPPPTAPPAGRTASARWPDGSAPTTRRPCRRAIWSCGTTRTRWPGSSSRRLRTRRRRSRRRPSAARPTAAGPGRPR